MKNADHNKRIVLLPGSLSPYVPLLMPRPFLTAEWRNLLMVNYAIEPDVLKKYLPCHTELDEYNGLHFISLVGFLFQNTKVLGLSIPYHRHFPEVNLRFYVRYKEAGMWKRGVVFVKEIVPKRMITLVANGVYNEKYATHAMRYEHKTTGTKLSVAYEWKVGNEWNYLRAEAAAKAQSIVAGSIEEFITEHYWGYTLISNQCSGEYGVLHPQWKVHPVTDFSVKCSVPELYGNDFETALRQAPATVLLAEGSPIEVLAKKRILQ